MLRTILAILLCFATGVSAAWEYDTSRDEMRSLEIKTARLASINEIEDRHQRATFLHIVLRDWPGEGRHAMLRVSSGSFDCYRACHVVAKFDDGDLVTYTAVRGGSGNSDWLFINERQGFERRIKGATRLILEAPLFRLGARQFSFDVDGLEWP